MYSIKDTGNRQETAKQMDLNESILQVFNRLAYERKPVNLYNLYKSVPIIHEGIISRVDKQGYINITTHKHQILCMNRDADTTIISEYFPGYIKAKAKTIDLNNKAALLGNFKYINENSSSVKLCVWPPKNL